MVLSGEKIPPVENSIELSMAPKGVELLEIWIDVELPKKRSKQSLAYMEE